MHLVQLKKHHTLKFQIQHPLLDGCKQLSESELNDKVCQCMITGEGHKDLIMSFRSVLRYLVSLYAGNWPCCQVYIDDMVCEGAKTIVRFVNEELNEYKDPSNSKSLKNKSACKVVSYKIQNSIESMLNSLRALAAPDPRSQRRYIANGEDPCYVESSDLSEIDVDKEELDNDTYKVDILEVVDMMKGASDIDDYLLNRENWGRNAQEIAQELHISRQAVSKRKQQLYKQFLDLTR